MVNLFKKNEIIRRTFILTNWQKYRRFFIVSSFLLLVLSSVLGGIYCLFETPYGNSLLFKGIHTYFAYQNIDITIEGLQGDFPRNFSLSRIELKDASSQDTFLKVDNINLALYWPDLFKGKITLNTLHIENLSLFSSSNVKTHESLTKTLQETLQETKYLFALPYFLKIGNFSIKKGTFILNPHTLIDFQLSGHINFATKKERSLVLQATGISLPWKGELSLQQDKEKKLLGHLLFEDEIGVFFKDYGSFKGHLNIESQENQIKGDTFIQVPSLGDVSFVWDGTFFELPFEGHIALSSALSKKLPFLSQAKFNGIFFVEGDILSLKELNFFVSKNSFQIPKIQLAPFLYSNIEAHFCIEELPFVIPPHIKSFIPIETITGSVSFHISHDEESFSFSTLLKTQEDTSFTGEGFFSFKENLLSLHALKLNSPYLTIDGKGDTSIDFKKELYFSVPITFSFSSQNFFPSIFLENITGEVQIEGPLSHLSFHSEISLPYIEWEEEKASDLSLSLQGIWSQTDQNKIQTDLLLKGIWHDSSATFQSTVEWEETNGIEVKAFSFAHPTLNAKGSFLFHTIDHTKGDFIFQGTSFHFLKKIFFEKMQGRLNWKEKEIKAEFSGQKGDLFEVQLNSLDMKGTSQSWQGEKVAFSIDAQELKIKDLIFSKIKVLGKGDLSSAPSFLNGSFFINDTSESSVEIEYNYTKKQAKHIIKIPKFKGKIGPLDINLSQGFSCTYAPNFIEIPKTDLSINGHILTFFLKEDSSTLKGSLSFPFFALKDLQGINPAFRFPIVLKKGEVLLSGTRQNPLLSYKATIAPSPSSEGWGPAIPSFTGSLQGKWKDSILDGTFSLNTINNLEYIKGSWKIPIGRQDTNKQQPLALSFEGKGSLETLAPFLVEQGDILKGEYQTAFHITGSIEKPIIQGNLNITKGLYQSFQFGTLFQDVTLKIGANTTSLIISEGTGHDNQGGKITLSGGYAWGGERSTLIIDLKNFQLVALDMVNGLSTGSLLLQKDPNVLPTLTGTILLDPLSVHLPKQLPTNIKTLDVIRLDKTTQTQKDMQKEEQILLKDIEAQTQEKLSIRPLPPFTEEESVILSKFVVPAIPLDLQVNLPGKFVIDGHGLKSSWRGNVQIGGTLKDPSLSGTIHLQKGTFAFFGKTFSLQKGYLLFTGTSKIDPDVDIVAQITTGGIVANILITGGLSSPQFSLTSSPALSSNEIISRILFGKDIGSLSPFQSLQIVSALSELTGTANPTNFVDQIRDSLGLGGLSFTSGGTDGSGSGLSLGKYLSDDVFVDIEQGLDAEDTKASVEIKIFPEVTLQSDVGADSSAGVGLNWRYEY